MTIPNAPRMPICLPQTREAKFLRALDVSPSADAETLKRAAGEFSRQFKDRYEWYQMPDLIRMAWGEIVPIYQNVDDSRSAKPPCRRPRNMRLMRSQVADV